MVGLQRSGSQYGPEQAGLGSGNGFLGLLGDYGSGGLRRRHACDDGAQQAVPGREQEIGGDGAEVFEQRQILFRRLRP